VFVSIITQHNEQTSPIRSNPHTPSLQRHSHCGRQFIVDCCVLSLNGSHLRPRPHPSLLDEPSYSPAAAAAAASSPGCCGCCCFLARLLSLLLLLLPPRPTAAAAASSPDCCGCCCCSQYRGTILRSVSLFRDVYQRSFSSTVRSGKVR